MGCAPVGTKEATVTEYNPDGVPLVLGGGRVVAHPTIVISEMDSAENVSREYLLRRNRKEINIVGQRKAKATAYQVPCCRRGTLDPDAAVGLVV
jgi:hypothetical protein